MYKYITMILPKSYMHDHDFHDYRHPRQQQLVIDRQCHTLGVHRHCGDFDLPRQPIELVDWSMITYVDFKVWHQPTELQLQYLQRFLDNAQPNKILHLALYYSASSEFVHSLDFVAEKMVLDLHDYHCVLGLDQRVQHHLQLPIHRFTYADYYYLDEQYCDLKAAAF